MVLILEKSQKIKNNIINNFISQIKVYKWWKKDIRKEKHYLNSLIEI
jgi:hypothetical protein